MKILYVLTEQGHRKAELEEAIRQEQKRNRIAHIEGAIKQMSDDWSRQGTLPNNREERIERHK